MAQLDTAHVFPAAMPAARAAGIQWGLEHGHALFADDAVDPRSRQVAAFEGCERGRLDHAAPGLRLRHLLLVVLGPSHQLPEDVIVENCDHLPGKLVLVVVLCVGELRAAASGARGGAPGCRRAVHVAPGHARARHDRVPLV